MLFFFFFPERGCVVWDGLRARQHLFGSLKMEWDGMEGGSVERKQIPWEVRYGESKGDLFYCIMNDTSLVSHVPCLL